jgi:hypothetical protein
MFVVVKRLLSANSSEILAMTASELKAAIQANEGRTILSENVVVHEPLAETITNAEVASAFGADLILLNHFDVQHPFILGLNDGENSLANVHDDLAAIQQLKHLVGRPVGINLEPIAPQAQMLSEKLPIALGRQANAATVKKATELGVDFICLTGNPGTGVDNATIIATLREVRANFSGLIIAGKMHSAGVNEPIIDSQVLTDLIDAGADIILVPAVGTVPGFDAATLTAIVGQAHQHGALVMSAIGTSQESATTSVIETIALQNKICGVDIQHIGDAGAAGMAPVENILALSKTIRGQRHTLKQMARSINR